MDELKTITMYLPQFHCIPENDEWWGEGFTEWTAVRGAKSLYEGHKQPKVPLHENYYNLLEKQTMMQQAALMKEYGIDGQCFYHYYFKDGRKILEQPAENLLRWKDIDMPFCLCWASASWTRTWSNIRGNVWSDVYEKKKVNAQQQSAVLLEQKYGREEEWRKHFEYLLPFFKDERYIKKDGAPVFCFFDSDNIYCLNQMIDFWKDLAKAHGLQGIYCIGMNISSKVVRGLDALVLHAPPMFWVQKYDGEKKVFTADYEEIWDKIIAAKPSDKCRTYFEGFVNYDDTPRRGKNGMVVQNFSFEKFYAGMRQLYRKSLYFENDFVFVNAWNEWGEGMYLEPDEENGHKCLEMLKKAKLDAAAEKNYEFVLSEGNNIVNAEEIEQQRDKYKKMVDCFERWMLIKEEDKVLSDYLTNLSIKTVAIYGMGILGRHLLTELEKSNIEIKYIVDRRSEINNPKYKIVNPNDDFEEVDAVIITAIGDTEEIYNRVKTKTKARIFWLEEILFES